MWLLSYYNQSGEHLSFRYFLLLFHFIISARTLPWLQFDRISEYCAIPTQMKNDIDQIQMVIAPSSYNAGLWWWFLKGAGTTGVTVNNGTATLSGPCNKAFEKATAIAKAITAGFERLQKDPNAGTETRDRPSDENKQDQPDQGKATTGNARHDDY